MCACVDVNAFMDVILDKIPCLKNIEGGITYYSGRPTKNFLTLVGHGLGSSDPKYHWRNSLPAGRHGYYVKVGILISAKLRSRTQFNLLEYRSSRRTILQRRNDSKEL